MNFFHKRVRKKEENLFSQKKTKNLCYPHIRDGKKFLLREWGAEYSTPSHPIAIPTKASIAITISLIFISYLQAFSSIRNFTYKSAQRLWLGEFLNPILHNYCT